MQLIRGFHNLAHRAELENATEKYESKVAEIEESKAQADIHVTLIAKGFMHIEG